MSTAIPHLRTALVALGLVCATALAQEPQETPPAPEPEQVEPPPLPVLQPPGSEDSARDEMIELFQKVERRLGEIDDMLYDASAGDAIDPQEESGIGDLIQRSIEGAEEVREAMDRILEIAQEQGQQQQSQSGGQSGSQSSPLDAQPQGQEGSKETTPESPTPQQEPTPDQQPEGHEPGGEGPPESPRESVDDPSNNAASDPQAGETGASSGAQGNERWGDLPTHVRDLFRTEGGGDMPPQYRDWIDAYYRRLNQRP